MVLQRPVELARITGEWQVQLYSLRVYQAVVTC